MQPPDPVVVDQEPTEQTPIGAPTLRQSGRALLFSVGYIAALIGLIVATVRITSAPLSGFGLFIVLLGGAGVMVAFAIHVHVLRRDRLPLTAIGFTRPTWKLLHLLWQIPLIVISCAIVAAIVLVVLLQQEPTPTSAIGDIVASWTWPTVVVVLLVLAVVTPLWEEVLFRGLLFSALTRTMPTIVATILSSALFAAVHLAPPAMIYQFLVGVGCCWLYARHRTLWAPIALHAVNNTLVTALAITA